MVKTMGSKDFTTKPTSFFYISKKVYQEGETRVYQNMKMQPRAFFVKAVTSVGSKQDAIDFLFREDLTTKAVVENNPSIARIYSPGKAQIVRYSPEKNHNTNCK